MPEWNIEGCELVNIVDIPMRDNIHPYQCDDSFIIWL